MKRLLPLLLILPACATPTRIVSSTPDGATDPAAVARALATADVVVLGELHGNSSVHALHLEIVKELHALRPGMAVAMEMFERDVQLDLSRYFVGDIDEETFLARSRPWPHYKTDYRPLVEYARENAIPVLAANAPRSLAMEVARKGLAAVAGNELVAEQVSWPKDGYWDAFVAEMSGGASHGAHGKPSDEMLERFYQSQCLKDDTMAETVVRLKEETVGEYPPRLVVLVCGRFHSDRGFGAVARIRSRNPSLVVKVLSAEAVPDDQVHGFRPDPAVADFTLVVGESANRPSPMAEQAAKAAAVKPKEGAAAAEKPAAAAAPAATVDMTGRPALGVRPDYEFGGTGLRIEDVVAGGAAQQAGLEAGDVLVELDGDPVEDVQGYMMVLNGLTVGTEVKAAVVRGSERKEFVLKVGSRQ
ncbi:MAG: hypothetical protein RL148_3263 [Planctomycetota bacterium]|jgi:uncharacterized iron-regulated protein